MPNATKLNATKLADAEIIDRQVGRNAQLFAQAVAALHTPQDRFPYLRILVSLVEQAHPEWEHAPQKHQQIARLVQNMSQDGLPFEEVVEVVRVRDAERNGYHGDGARP